MPSIIYRNQEKDRDLTKPEDRARADKLAVVAAIDRYTAELKLQRENKETENASATHFWSGQFRKVRWLNYATAAVAFVALLAVIALYASLSNSRLAGVQANRAWIVSTKAWAVPQTMANGPLYVIAAIANPSRTPALDHIYKADIQATDGQSVRGKHIAEFVANNNICDGVHPVKDHSVVYPTNASDEFRGTSRNFASHVSESLQNAATKCGRPDASNLRCLHILW